LKVVMKSTFKSYKLLQEDKGPAKIFSIEHLPLANEKLIK